MISLVYGGTANCAPYVVQVVAWITSWIYGDGAQCGGLVA